MTFLSKFSAVQKRAIKWINGQQFDSYSDREFDAKQRELKILPIRLKFIHNSLMIFYKIVNKLICISLPNYLTVAEANTTRYTRSTASVVEGQDTSTYCCSVVPNCDSFRNSFFLEQHYFGMPYQLVSGRLDKFLLSKLTSLNFCGLLTLAGLIRCITRYSVFRQRFGYRFCGMAGFTGRYVL